MRDSGEGNDRCALADRFRHRQRVATTVEGTAGDDLLDSDRRSLAGKDRDVEPFLGKMPAGLRVECRRIADQIIERRDEIDLAQLLRLGLLAERYIYPREERAARDLSRKRMQLVRYRTAQIL